MTDVVFPPVGDAGAEGVLATWFVGDGEPVAEGDLIAEVAVDKVDMELTAPAGGVIHLLAKEGDVRRQGAVIARIDQPHRPGASTPGDDADLKPS